MAKPNRDKVRFHPMKSVREAFAKGELNFIETAAWEALLTAKMGSSIHYLKFAALDRTFCLASRPHASGRLLDIEYDFISPGTTSRVITTEEHHRNEQGRRDRRRGGRTASTLSGTDLI